MHEKTGLYLSKQRTYSLPRRLFGFRSPSKKGRSIAERPFSTYCPASYCVAPGNVLHWSTV